MNICEEKLLPFTVAVSRSLETNNYYAALSVALTLPDICTKLKVAKGEKSPSGVERYTKFFDEFLLNKYQFKVGANQKLRTFLTGRDFYGLRCSFLHQGTGEVDSQSVTEVLNKVVLVSPSENIYHNNFIVINDKKTLQLRVDIFCKEIIQSVKAWIRENKNDAIVIENLETLLSIETIENSDIPMLGFDYMRH